MRRFIATYRWELWLLLAIPAAAGMVRVATQLAFRAIVAQTEVSAETVRLAYTLSPLAAASLVSALLLGICYPLVRRLNRDLLPLIWGYSLASAAILAPVYFTGAALSFTVEGLRPLQVGFWVTGVGLTGAVLVLPFLILFARRASRLSLSHAFFLVLIGGFSLPSWGWNWLFWSTGAGVSLVLALLAVWLLGNFESRGQVFRVRAVLAVLALNGIGRLVHWVLSIIDPGVSIGLNLSPSVAAGVGSYFLEVLLAMALVYLVRVRDPAAGAEPPVDLRVQ